ncbi:hypothetical protein [Paenibacillus chitinolyticus]|uniref:hypothetical protein n=1 Tax=Paenibacillus chitinolyticus TaxID=79263 RepID=UPI00366F91A9
MALIWILIIMACLLAVTVSIGLIISKSNKSKGVLGQFQSKHVYGVPNLDSGVGADIKIYSDKLTINDTQIIPIDRYVQAKCLLARELKLSEKQKSVILRAVTGGMLLGPIGAIVGGMSGLANQSKQEEILQPYIQVTYLDIKNEKKEALFLTEYSYDFTKGIVRLFNESAGRETYVEELQYEI